jgi:hypothetical protein
MPEVLTVIGLIAGSFAATNFDNLALLVGWLLSDRGAPRRVLAGHLAGMASLLVLSFAWFGLARLLERHANRIRIIERYGHWLAPIVPDRRRALHPRRHPDGRRARVPAGPGRARAPQASPIRFAMITFMISLLPA